MCQKKTPKTQEAYKAVYIGHNPHSIPLSERKWPERVRVISVDPGITFFAVRFEERPIRVPGPIITLHFDKIGLKKEEQELSEDSVCPVYSFISNYLDQYLELFKTCHIVIIEKQLPVNYRAVRMSQHTLTYFMTHLKNIKPNLAMFFEVAPTLKGRELGAPPNLNEKGIKAWSIEKARELLIERNDQKGLVILDRKDPITKRKEKKDDLSDTIIQAHALFSHFGWLSPINNVSNNNANTVRLNIPVNTRNTGTGNIKLKLITNNDSNNNSDQESKIEQVNQDPKVNKKIKLNII